ncbi:helix-turn-helix domain-containing protein [Caulobacter sp. 17J65-9]|uniref:helix-turn-helix domain-containing protein n=1 Tax=Caulobacter sp. 17J65-9 TaxID=2709382 RepID=UPI0013C5DC1E|nr:helix-turn-helix domain-containing protein [Caulobacter sp. 17J65-9]NEX95286.1 helix-turn-helix domain-containing protein [Caulobacter sp. 17J65-9]
MTVASRIDVEDVSPELRKKAIPACEILLRLIRTITATQREDLTDLETSVIYIAVACATVSGAMRDPAVLELLDAGQPIPDEARQPVSRRAIAESTGLPRETVRRKIAVLVEKGFLIEEGGGVRTPPDPILHHQNLKFVRELVHELERAPARLARYD